MRRTLSVILALTVTALPVAVRAQDSADAGTPPPGRAVELEQCPAADGTVPDGGCVVPFKGSLNDRERMGAIYAKRIAAELDRDALKVDLQQAKHERDEARVERDEIRASKPPSWGTFIGVVAGAVVVGLAGGIALTLAIQNRVGK